jgi:uncharacterized iron-regulated protein
MHRWIAPVLITPLLSACVAQEPLNDPEQPYPLPHPPEVGDILHLPTGYYVERDTLLQHASEVRVVYVGETHDNPASHRLQLEILEYLQSRHPGRAALAMEMFTPDQQPVLDRWSRGELKEKEFLKEVRWFETWRMDFGYYRPLLEFARENRIPVVGLNAPSSRVDALARSAPEDLPPEIREQLPELDFSDPYQRALVDAIYGAHAHGRRMREGFLRVQTLWDESMAANLARFLQSPTGRDRRVVVAAGGNHVRFGFGIPRRLFRRLPVSYLLVGTKEIEIPDAKQDRVMDVAMPRFPMVPYHFVVFTRYEDLPETGVKLGVHLEEAERCVGVHAVVPGSAGERAGLRAGDRLCRLDRIELNDAFDLVYELQQRRPGDTAVLVVERDGETLELSVEFAGSGTSPKDE